VSSQHSIENNKLISSHLTSNLVLDRVNISAGESPLLSRSGVRQNGRIAVLDREATRAKRGRGPGTARVNLSERATPSWALLARAISFGLSHP